MQRKRIIKRKKKKQTNDALCVLLSVICPGLGHLINGKILSALIWFLGVPIFYFLWIPFGILIHLCCIVSSSEQLTNNLRIW